MESRNQELRRLVAQTMVAYVRMASTVVIAVVVRLCLDCFGLIITGQDPTAASFWFAHCQKDGTCVLAGIVLFFVSLAGGSLFAWSCQDWITDPVRNPLARKFSFAILIEAATWIPISVAVGKTNALVEWFMDIAENDVVQALLSSGLAALLTLSCALLTHVAMKYCRGVADRKGVGVSGFLRFFLLATITCLGWAVAWSNWELVLSLMDALEPGTADHDLVLARAVIAICLVLSACFYLRFGPEPIIPDPELQQICYSHGYSSSVQRSLVSYIVYSCVICMVMACCDPTYGLLISLAKAVYASTTSMFDAEALFVLCLVACAVTFIGALCSAAITWVFEVDSLTSMRLSRSVNRACKKMVSHRRSRFEAMLSEVQKAGSDACFLEAGPIHEDSGGSLPPEESDDDEPKAANLAATQCEYSRMPLSDEDAFSEVDSERQLQLNPGAISNAVCVSVLIYDVLGFVVCFQWGMLAVRCYSVLFGRLAGKHLILYVISCLFYAAAVTAAITRAVMAFFPSAEEKSLQEESGQSSLSSPRSSRRPGESGRLRDRVMAWLKFPFLGRHARDIACQELCENLHQPSDDADGLQLFVRSAPRSDLWASQLL
eukprot:TRINITY_DN36924_c0_g1_i2.p1 TRINITY_DN36924_c0_g1~~TRINITY_DN36924_c0_g1_i2.p1  ORF type:complete len:622 (-),score=105.47 TRINITY_DN36924_c0_g1_i2:28-1839(-)